MEMSLLAAAALLLAGCASNAPVEGPVRLGQIAFVNGPRVRPDRIIEDSRCPAEAQCVWAGRLIVRVTVLGGGWARQVDLTLGVPISVADGSLTLLAATPLRRPDERSDKPLPYRFRFEFQGGL